MKLLDLFCGAGGAAMGYYRAGFTDITGVDIKPMPRYPFKFVQGDALEYLKEHGREYDVIHASPPCQGYSRMRHLPWIKGHKYDLLIEPVREMLVELSRHYIIENVSDAPLDGYELCGLALGLNLIRHRRFEMSDFMLFPPCPGHPIIFSGRAEMSRRGKSGGVMGVIGGDAKKSLDIDWMTNGEMRQAIPPAYTEFIGRQLIQILERGQMKTIAVLFVILSILLAPFVSAQAAPEVGQCRVLSWDSNGIWIVWYSANMSGGPYYSTFRLDSYNGHPTLITGTDAGWIIEGTTVKTHLSWPFLKGETWKLSGLICFDGMGDYQEATQDWWYAWVNIPGIWR